LTNARAALGNLIKYGILIDPFQWIKIFFENPLHRPTFILILILNLFILCSLLIEILVSKGRIQKEKAKNYFISNIVLLIITPIVVNILFECNPILSSLVCTVYSVVSLKLISYHSVNYWCRTKIRYGKPITKSIKVKEEYIAAQKTKDLVKYPNNVGVIDIYYFMFAPTLCYQINFPRTERIRIRFLFTRFLEFVSHSKLINIFNFKRVKFWKS
jgi:diacylglycerol O-acyltransferase-1